MKTQVKIEQMEMAIKWQEINIEHLKDAMFKIQEQLGTERDKLAEYKKQLRKLEREQDEL